MSERLGMALISLAFLLGFACYMMAYQFYPATWPVVVFIGAPVLAGYAAGNVIVEMERKR